MAEITLDLATKIISPDQHIWSIFPGTRKRFLDQFVQDGVIFLDMPGLKLSPNVLGDEDLLRKHIAMSHAIRRWHLSQEPGDFPSRSAKSYAPRKSAAASAQLGNVRGVFQRMQTGDLIVTAGHKFYDAIHIGEITSEWSPKDTVHFKAYGRELIPVRRVRWLRVTLERRFLPLELSQLLSNRKAVIQIPKGPYGDQLYRAAYGDYVFGENSRYVFPGPKYKNIGLSLVPGIKLISYFSAACYADQIGELDKFGELAIEEAIDRYFEQDLLKSFEVDFSSPGAYVLLSKVAKLPLLVAALVAITSGGVSLQDARAATIVNSAERAQMANVHGCKAVQIEERFRTIMTSINTDRYNKLCALNDEAKHGVGLTVPIKRRTQP